MTYPVAAVIRPNLTNGRIPLTQLTQVTLPGTRQACYLYNPAARALDAMVAEVFVQHGVTLTGSTPAPGDCYRSYDQQLAVFNQRYRPTYNPLTCTLADARTGPDGTRWYKLRGVAAVASPGTSNHGLGIAIDLAIWDGTKAVAITSNLPLFTWLLVNAIRFGFSWESQSEPWHLRHVLGDEVASAVKAYEAGFVKAPIERRKRMFLTWWWKTDPTVPGGHIVTDGFTWRSVESVEAGDELAALGAADQRKGAGLDPRKHKALFKAVRA